MPKRLLSGNEALSQAAWEAGVTLAFGYPGSPSTAALENLAQKEEVICQWSANEKVALEACVGASFGGARTLCTMKNVGLHVAMDAAYSFSLTGVGAGAVIYVADDPGCHFSQGEPDSRAYARLLKIPVLEPADAEEAYTMTLAAYKLSEEFSCPVMLRMTSTVAETKQLVEVLNTRDKRKLLDYEAAPEKRVLMPKHARARLVEVEKRSQTLEAASTQFNKQLLKSSDIGIVCSGAHYHYVQEVMPEASIYKVGMVWPLPEVELFDFSDSVKRLYVLDEAGAYLEDQLWAMGLELSELPGAAQASTGELTLEGVRRAFKQERSAQKEIVFEAGLFKAEKLPKRPPTLCMGCPHRLALVELRRMKAIVMGDIGCYTIGAALPFNMMDAVLEMGASIPMGQGLALTGADKRTGQPIFSVIGDSTFAHSGIAGLMSAAYNGCAANIVILDNRTTAMTGMQGNPISGVPLQAAQKAKEIDLEALVLAAGADEVTQIDGQDGAGIRESLHEMAAHSDKLSVLIVKSPCQLIKPKEERTKMPAPKIEACRRCGVCTRIGCAALTRDETGYAIIDQEMCIGCNQCVQECPYGCIHAMWGE